MKRLTGRIFSRIVVCWILSLVCSNLVFETSRAESQELSRRGVRTEPHVALDTLQIGLCELIGWIIKLSVSKSRFICLILLLVK